jgi:hypothetical protein
MTDFSFLRLNQNFATAKYDEMHESEYFYNGGICLHPLERYLQTTNSLTDIAFDDSYKVELVNCKEDVIKDITNRVFITEFQDNNGIYQISFEIAPLNEDFYYDALYLKFTHLNSSLRLYSNKFIVTAEEQKNSFRLDYKSYSVYKGTNYVLADYYQSIRLLGFFNGISEKKDSKLYTEINGKIRKSRIIQSFEHDYNIEYVNTFVYERLCVALENDLVYLNGTFIEILDDVSAGERIGKSNLFEANFKVQFDKTQTYEDIYQIAPPLIITELLPLGDYTLASVPTTGKATFNNDIVYVSGKLKLYDYNTDILLNEINITIANNYFEFTMPILDNGEYYFLFDNLINDVLLQTISGTDKEQWKFNISAGDYNNTQYKTTQYFTN